MAECGSPASHHRHPYVKPHGALYNDAHHDAARARTIIDAMLDLDPSIAIVAPDHSQMADQGVPVIREAFPDRRYGPDGSLTPRGVPGSTLSIEEAAAQAALLARDSVVVARDGSRVASSFDTLSVTLSVHADGAVERLRAARHAIQMLTG